jgi:hypothetical protein
MSFFRCSRCHCKEDTALCNYWSARLKQSPAVCSACDPKIAKWHGQFVRESADDWRTDERGILTWSKRDVEDWLGQPIEVIGAAAEKPKQDRSFQRPPARAAM